MKNETLLSILEERKKEIVEYIISNELKIATTRIMDFAKEFSNTARVNETVIHKQTYTSISTNIRLFGETEKETRELKRLSKSLLDFVDEIIGEFDEDKSSISKIDKTTNIKQAKKKFFAKDENIVFRCNQLSKTYKNKSICFEFSPIDLELKLGEITAIVGENGNGKTTLLNMIAGKLLQSSGKMRYPELVENREDDWYHMKTQISYIEQELPKWQGFLKDNLHFTLGINGIKGQKNIDEVNFIIHRLGLEKYYDAKWSEVSGGFKMRFSLARAILRKPKLLILDEPLANLDINTQNIFLTDLRDLVNSVKDRMSVIVSSQNLYEVEGIADNIIFLSDGKALYNGTVEDFGEDREENSYEVYIDILENELLTILKSVQCTEVKQGGRNYIINTKLSVTVETLLKLFFDNGVKIRYFRDISKSTRKLFGEIK